MRGALGILATGIQSHRGRQLDAIDEASELTKRQAELESLMKQPGGARVTEEKELQDVKRKLGTLTLSARAARCSLADLGVEARAAGNATKIK
jgi:hypothetical protein